MGTPVELTDEQREKLTSLWFIWGNHGPKTNRRNHKFIQQILEREMDHRGFYKPDKSCTEAVDKVLLQRSVSDGGKANTA